MHEMLYEGKFELNIIYHKLDILTNILSLIIPITFLLIKLHVIELFRCQNLTAIIHGIIFGN